MKKIYLVAILVAGLLLLGACTNETPTPAPIPEPAIPAHFTTYTDELALFSISYPAEWEPVLSVMEGIEESVKDIMTSVDSNVPLENASIIFMAGILTEDGNYEPNVNIIVEPLHDIDTQSELVEASIRKAEIFIDDYHVLSRIETTVDGREATIINAEGTYPQMGKFHGVQMIVKAGSTSWTITCAPPQGEFSRYEEDINSIVRSLRLRK
ncbi:PsbP-related protein [Chloroflexota bacterium]